jgi:hypothetical protein
VGVYMEPRGAVDRKTLGTADIHECVRASKNIVSIN